MLELNSNSYNQKQSRNQPKFKLWRSAGLILTYRCSAACRFCYYNCSPAPSPVMPVEMAVNAYAGLKRLAGDSAKIHLTGGEAFLEWERLEEIIRAVKAEKLGPIEQIETNASWAIDDTIIAERLNILDVCGMEQLKISCDPFHQEFVPIENVKRLANKAQELLGASRVVVRWQKYLDAPLLTAKMYPAERNSVHLDSLKEFPCRFTGRAAGELAQVCAGKTIEQIASRNCRNSFLAAKGVHIDPLGNVFSGVCSGIILGSISDEGLDQIWRRIDWQKEDVTAILFRDGPAGLVEKAIKLGYKEIQFYSSGCHLCTSVRQFLYNLGTHKSIGPAYCYADGAAKTIRES